VACNDAQPLVRRTIGTPVVVVMCAAAVVALCWYLFVHPVEGSYGLFTNGVDTRVYRGGGRAVLHGTPLYDVPVYRYWWFTYPPFAALLMTPLALVSAAHAVALVQVVNVICLFLFTALILNAMGFSRDRRFWVTAVAAALGASMLEPVQTTIFNGQVNLVLAVIVVGCLTLMPGAARGVGVGLAAGIKLTPIFFVVYFAITRQFRAMATALTVFVATVVIGLVALRGQAWHYWTNSGNTSHIGVEAVPPNQSIHGQLDRLEALGLLHAPGWLWVPIGLVVGVIGLYTAWRVQRAGATMLAITVVGMTSCAVSPFSWGHHWVWFVPLILVAVVAASDRARRDRPATWLWWLAPAVITTGTLAWRFRVAFNGEMVWRTGSFRVFWDPDAHGGSAVLAAIGSASYLILFAATIAVCLGWAVRTDP
jgi:alpha-1,2-mannosyltransferase